MRIEIVRRLPTVGRLFAGRPDRGATATGEAYGEVWRPVRHRGAITAVVGEPQALPLVVVFCPNPAAFGWIASSVSAALPSVVVVATDFREPLATLDAIASHADYLGADPARLAIIGESDAASSAISSCAGARHVTRLALVSPVVPAAFTTGGIPPCLLQFSAAAPGAPAVRELETSLREDGVAVRSIDYTSLEDGWARYPRAVRGSRRGLDDLLGFLKRGFGVESTFRVIPGWDLH